MRRVEGIDRICRDWCARCDAPNKSGRFRCHPSKLVACHTCAAANETPRRRPRSDHHKKETSVARQVYGSAERNTRFGR